MTGRGLTPLDRVDVRAALLILDRIAERNGDDYALPVYDAVRNASAALTHALSTDPEGETL